MVGMSAVGGMDEAIGFFFTVGSNAHMPRCFARPPRCTSYRRLPKDIFYSILLCYRAQTVIDRPKLAEYGFGCGR